MFDIRDIGVGRTIFPATSVIKLDPKPIYAEQESESIIQSTGVNMARH